MRINYAKEALMRYGLLICSSLSVMCTAIMSPALPMIKKTFTSYENAELLIKLSATAPNMCIAIFAPIFGLFLCKLNFKKALVLFVICYTISGCFGFFTTTLESLIISRCILGISLGGLLTISIEAISRNYHHHERNKILALQTTTMSIISIFFTIFSGILADVNWKYAFLLYGTGLFILPMIFCYTQNNQEGLQENVNNNITSNKSTFEKILGGKLPAMICFISFINMVFFYMIPIQIPFVLKSVYPSINSKMISLVITIEVVMSAIFVVKYKRLKKNRSFETVCALSLAIMSLSYLGLSYVRNYYAIFFWVGIYGIGMAFMMPNNIVWLIQSIGVKYRGFWIGMLTTAIYLGKFSSPLVLKPIVDNFGLFKSYRVIAVLMLFLAILFSFLGDTLKHKVKRDNIRKKI